MIPLIALLGRPNVGKSTLFNCLTRTNDALVADEPGLTRDRQYGIGQIDDKAFMLVDTGGIGVDDHRVDELMSQQSLRAVEEADLIFFVVDAKAGVTPIDREIADQLRKTPKKTMLVVNKVDGVDRDIALSDFYQLGFTELAPIAATHRRGTRQLLLNALEQFTDIESTSGIRDKVEGIGVAVIGRPNVGKSTLINRLMGEERVVAYDMPGTTRDSVFIPFEKNSQQYTLIDTAGIRKKGRVSDKVEKFSIIKALKAIELSHVCLILINAQEGVYEQDLHLIRFAADAGKGLLIVVNKWDGLEEEQRLHVKAELDRRLAFISYASWYFISAKHGTGVGKLLPMVSNIYKACHTPLQTSLLTRVLEQAVSNHPPPLVRGRRIKLRYAHAGGHNPPIIIIHGNQTEALPLAYKRYLSNVFREAFNLQGTPVVLDFKSSDNPYQGKKNTLTLSQQRKRKRLLKRVKKNK